MQSKKRLFAKGRLKAGRMNGTEAAYAKHLQSLMDSGEIKWFKFDCVTLKVADNLCRYSPDFLVLKSDDSLEIHEVKGSMRIFQDDAKVKVKVCADEYPFRFIVVVPIAKKDGGGWAYHDY